MSEERNNIKFEITSQERNQETGRGQPLRSASFSTRTLDSSETTTKARPKADIQDLYPSTETHQTKLRTIFSLLREAIDLANESVAATDSGNEIQADDKMQNIHALLPELFACREVGDGFGIIINGLMNIFDNKNGQPFSRVQAQAILEAVQKLRSELFLSPSAASDVLVDLEAADLDSDSALVDQIFDTP